MKVRHFSIFLFLLGFVSILSSCEAERRFDCKSKQDCSDGYVCTEAKTCVPGECTEHTECGSGRECWDFHCMDIILCDDNTDCQTPVPVCDKTLGKCVDCIPNCIGKCCGDDGCGNTCQDQCSLTGQTCNQTSCECEGECVPACEGKECGSDLCGNTCEPGCQEDESCSKEGKCECVSDCGERKCGPVPNGCGQSCGDCTGTDKCNEQTGTCEACTPDCGERKCGPVPNGCGENCGSCQGDAVCNQNTFKCEECAPDCTNRECGLDPKCGLECSPGCSGQESCSLEGKCGNWCELGSSRCSQDGFGFEACGPDSESGGNTFGERIPCKPDVVCKDGSCQRQVCQATEVIFLLDRSSSMSEAGVWSWVKAGFEKKMRERADLNYFGFRQFPTGEGCEVGEVLSPAKDNADEILGSIIDPSNTSATPIAKALDNLILKYGDASDGQAVVLITDGDENCEENKEVAIQKAGELFKKGVEVQVIAVTTSANKGFLDRLAQAGGSEQSRLAINQVELESALESGFQGIFSCRCYFEEQICEQNTLYRCNSAGNDIELVKTCDQGCLDEFQCRNEKEVFFPGESFAMGSNQEDADPEEKPQHLVNLAPFYLDAREVSNSEYRQCVDAGQCALPGWLSSGSDRPEYFMDPAYENYPVLAVSWFQARDFCRFMGKRLPSEAEWERAARGPGAQVRTYPWGEQEPTCDYSNFCDSFWALCFSCVDNSMAIDALPLGATPQEVLSLAGNLWEWTQDAFDPGYYKASPVDNPLGPDDSENILMDRVIRGGSYYSDKYNIRGFSRDYSNADYRSVVGGFRCAKSPQYIDHDGDGFNGDQGDCDDGDKRNNSSAKEICGDRIDNDCNQQVDDGCPEAIFQENTTEVVIPDATKDAENNVVPGSYVTSTITVEEDRPLYFAEVHIKFDHPAFHDLKVVLRHPDSEYIVLYQNVAGQVHLDHTIRIESFIGKPAKGDWQLSVRDEGPEDTGKLSSWSLKIY